MEVPIVAAAALALGTWLARPFAAGTVAFDSQVAALHFDRIASLHVLEAFLPTTPKPLLTIVVGPIYAVTHDWRLVSWAAVVALTIGVVLVYVLGRRLGGPIAGGFAAAAVAGAAAIDFDVGFALATPYALIGWAAAGLAVSAPRPRPVLAGAFLALATLARIETVALSGFLVAVLAGIEVRASVAAGPRPWRRWWAVPLIALLAIPVMCLHDWLLARDPLLWLTVSSRYTEATTLHVLSPREVVELLVDRYRAVGGVTILAVVGVAALSRQRQWAVLAGSAALGGGIAALLVALAVRGTFVSDRYAAGIDVAVAFAGGIGAAAVARWVADALARRLDLRRLGLLLVLRLPLAALAAVVLAWPRGPLDPTLDAQLVRARDAAAATDAVLPALRSALLGHPPTTSAPLFVPMSVLPRLALDLGLRLDVVDGTDGMRLDGGSGSSPPAGALVLHVPAAERNPGALAPLETDTPAVVGGRRIVPVASDPAGRWWLDRLDVTAS